MTSNQKFNIPKELHSLKLKMQDLHIEVQAMAQGPFPEYVKTQEIRHLTRMIDALSIDMKNTVRRLEGFSALAEMEMMT